MTNDAEAGNMVRGVAKIVSVSERTVWLEAENQAACGGCTAARGCGVSALAKVLGRRSIRLALPNSFEGRTGERIAIGIPQGALLRASVVSYLIPIGGLLAGALLVAGLGGGDGLAVLGALCGLGAGFLASRRIAAGRARSGELSAVYLGRAEAADVFPQGCEIP